MVFIFWLRYSPDTFFQKVTTVLCFEKNVHHMYETCTICMKNRCPRFMKNLKTCSPYQWCPCTSVEFVWGSHYFLWKSLKIAPRLDPVDMTSIFIDRSLLFLIFNLHFLSTICMKTCTKLMKKGVSYRPAVIFLWRLLVWTLWSSIIHCYLQWILTLTFILPRPYDIYFKNTLCFSINKHKIFLLHFCADIYYTFESPKHLFWVDEN